MSYGYMLVKLDNQGNEIWQGTFDSESTLLEAIKERPKLTVDVASGKILVDTAGLSQLAKYRVKRFTMNSLRSDEAVVEVDLPSISLTVPSESDPSKSYGVAVLKGEVVACTCPDFVYTKSQQDYGSCKHMNDVKLFPSRYDLHRGVQDYTVVTHPAEKFGFDSRLLPTWAGSPGSWRS